MHIKTSMLLVEITGMLYIGNCKIRFVRVLQSPRDSTKLLHLDIVYLSNKRKRFQVEIALVWRVDRDAFGGTQWPTFHIRQHVQKNANRVSCATCLELVQVQAQTITSLERNVSLLWMPGGHVAIASAVQDGGIV